MIQGHPTCGDNGAWQPQSAKRPRELGQEENSFNSKQLETTPQNEKLRIPEQASISNLGGPGLSIASISSEEQAIQLCHQLSSLMQPTSYIQNNALPPINYDQSCPVYPP